MKHNARKALILAAVMAVITLGMSTASVAKSANSTSQTTVNVTVTQKVAVDVHPKSLEFASASVGSQDNSSDGGFGAVDVENTGSEYIDRIWLNASMPDADPFGTGTASNYDAANFLQVKPSNASGLLQGDTDDFHYVNRKEYATGTDNEIPSYIQVDGQFNGSNPDDVIVGRFRMGSEERFFAIPVGSNNLCDGTSSADFNLIRVADTVHTSSNLGTVDFTDSGSDYTEYSIKELTGSNYGVTGPGPETPNGVILNKTSASTNPDRDFASRVYDVLTICDTSKSEADKEQVIRTRYNVEAGLASDLTSESATEAVEFLLNAGDTASNMLQPGDAVTAHTAIEVPRGVTEGSMDQGIFEVLVTADVNAN